MPLAGLSTASNSARKIRGGRDDARQPEQRKRRIVRVDRQSRADLLGDRRDLLEERDEVGAHVVGAERGEFAQSQSKPLARVGRLARRHAADDVLLDCGDRFAVEARQARPRGLDRLGGIVRLGPRPPENEDVVGDERRHVEAQRQARRRQSISQVRPRPVDDRHEIVADGRNARLGEAGEAVLPGVDITPVGSIAQLDRARDWNQFADVPAQARRFDGAFMRHHVVEAPGAPIGDTMQCADDSFSAGLLGVVQRDGIVGPEPAPGLLHRASPSLRDGARAHIPPIARTTTEMTSDRTIAHTTTAAV